MTSNHCRGNIERVQFNVVCLMDNIFLDVSVDCGGGGGVGTLQSMQFIGASNELSNCIRHTSATP